ncbi:MAG: universal stress protein [Anaerolineales bacterium]|nr:universal stress protein [Anaerolineales bacterium]
MFAKILVPLDGSKLAEQALPTALKLATAVGSEIVLMRVPQYHEVMTMASVGGEMPPIAVDGTDFAEAEAYLNDLRQLWQTNDITLSVRLGEGDPASAIVDIATDEQVDLIIMSTHGRTGLARWAMGSVAEKVLRAAQVPVIVTRDDRPIEKMLITLDGSNLASAAIEPAMRLAQALGARVTLLRVQPYESYANRLEIDEYMRFEYGLDKSLEDLTRKRIRWYLEDVMDQYAQFGVPIQYAIVMGFAADEILTYAEKEELDLVVMSTHGRTGLRRWVYGSVTEKVLRGAHCGVMVVRPTAEDSNT